MANLLYVTRNRQPVEQYRILTAATEFLDTYLKYNPNERVDFVDVYRDPIQRIDPAPVFTRESMMGLRSKEKFDDHRRRK